MERMQALKTAQVMGAIQVLNRIIETLEKQREVLQKQLEDLEG